jgi:hypothetical protein
MRLLPASVIEQLVVNGLYWEPVLVTAAFAALAWNEWRTHRRRRGLDRSREDAAPLIY